MESFRTFDDIEVNLIGSTQAPYDLAVASARTCYSGKGIVYPTEISKDERAVTARDRIAASTLEAGHLTTRQHAHFVFALSGVSRQFIWSFLHSHPFYNSEQVSQRYVRVKPGNFLMPPMPPQAQTIYTQTANAQMDTYEKLIEALREPIAQEYFERFPARKKMPREWQSAIDKKAFEVARYVLGVGTTAHLYHTISALTLLRYAKLCRHFETPAEQRVVIEKMMARVKQIDPMFEKDLSDPVPLESSLEYQCLQKFGAGRFENREDFISQFDTDLAGRTSKLVDYSVHAERVLANSVRVALGRIRKEIRDEDVLTLLLDPQKNPILADTLNTSNIDKLSQSLHHVHFTFQKKISHAADSQDQRHRTVPASRPVLFLHYGGNSDFVTPYGIQQSPKATEWYAKSMENSFSAVNRLLDSGVNPQFAFYLLPNATSIRMVTSGDLHGLHHKWKMRSCYNAQEEIFRATIDEIEQMNEVLPAIGEHLRAPCYLRLRAGLKPYCPEGDHFCGLMVWKYSIGQYRRKSL